MNERRVEKSHTRAAFVTFLMWLCVFVAASIGFRASKTSPQENRWMRCTYFRGCIFLFMAFVFGIVKLVLDYKIMKDVERMHKQMRMGPSNNIFGQHK